MTHRAVISCSSLNLIADKWLCTVFSSQIDMALLIDSHRPTGWRPLVLNDLCIKSCLDIGNYSSDIFSISQLLNAAICGNTAHDNLTYFKLLLSLSSLKFFLIMICNISNITKKSTWRDFHFLLIRSDSIWRNILFRSDRNSIWRAVPVVICH